MKSKVSNSLPWPLLVGAKFLQVHPVGTICAILLALPGQIALIASFLLPIKIIMLMASEGMPSFMPSITADMDKKMLISLLAGLSIAAFIFHHLTNKAIKAIARSGVSRIEKRNQKLHLFEGQEDLTRNSYTRYIDTVASVNFVLLSTALLFAIYPEVASILIIYIVACIFCGLHVNNNMSSNTEIFTNTIQSKLPTLANTGFFLTFSWILIDYIFLSIPSSFIALLAAIVIARQFLTQLIAITNSLFFFSRQKQKLRALLFHREVFQPVQNSNNSIFDFLDPDAPLHIKLHEILKSIPDTFNNNAELTWQDSGLPGISFLKAHDKDSGKTLLVKIFEKNKTTDARHEAALLLDAPDTLPCPKLVIDTVISGHSIHILDITDYQPLEISPQASKEELDYSISKVVVPSALLSRYIRSHCMLWDQLGELQLQQFKLTSKDGATVNTFLSVLPHIQDELKRLPLCLHNPQISNTNIRAQSPSGAVHLLHWGKWSLDPLGANLTRHFINNTSLGPLSFSPTNQNKQSFKRPPNPMTALLSRQLYQQTNQKLLLKAAKTMEELSQRYV